MAKIENSFSLTEMSIDELLDYEKAAMIICKKYENTVKDYTGKINQNREEYVVFERYNQIHHNILNELQIRLNKIK